AEIAGVEAGQRLVKARLYDETQSPRRLAAEAGTQVSVPYPTELLPDAAGDDEMVASLAAATHDGSVDEVLQSPGDPKGRERTKPLWPHVLWALLLPLLVFDLLLRRLSLGTRRIAA